MFRQIKQKLPSLPYPCGTQFTVEKSDFEWFATTARNCFCTWYKALQTLHENSFPKTILENLTGELNVTNIKQFEINLLCRQRVSRLNDNVA